MKIKLNKIQALCAVLSITLSLAACSNTAKINLEPLSGNIQKGTTWKTDNYTTEIIDYLSPETRLLKMTLIANDGGRELYFDSASCDIAYKTADSIYFSTPWDLYRDKKSVDTQKVKIASQLRLSYVDSKQNVSEIFSFPECVAKGQYKLEKIKNGVRVNMIIGRAEDKTLLPPVITSESFKKVYESLSGRAKNRLKAFYKLYDTNTTPQTQIDSIAEKYPIVKDMPIYVLKNVTDNEKQEIESYFKEAGYTFEDMEKDLKTVGAVAEDSISPRFEISIIYELKNGELAVSIPTELIKYDEKKFTLLEIGALEYFASAGCTGEGYIFVPDGNGAVFGFNQNGKKLGNEVKIPIYGYDRSLTYTSGNEKLMTAALPVFGIKSNSGTMLAMVDEGESVTDIIASTGGSVSGYARAGAVFNYSDYDVFEYKDVNTQYSWTLAEKNHYDGIYRICFAALSSGSGYSEMAEYYRNRLKLKEKASESTKLVLGLYGTIKHKEDFLFVPVKRNVALTTFEDAGIIADEMLENGIDSLDLRYIGWSNGGLNGRAYSSATVEGAIGGKSKLKKLGEKLNAKKVGLYLDANIAYVSNNTLFDGFTAMKDTSRMLDKTYAGYNKARLSSGLMNDEYFMYAVRPQSMWRIFNSFIKSYNKLNLKGISLSRLGSDLNSDKDIKRGLVRSTSQRYTEEILKKAADNYTVMTEGANSYVYKNASVLIDIPLSASGYPDADYAVPFLQMVLHGSVDYTTSAVNLSGNYRIEVLKAIENGSGLYFELACRNTDVLKDSTKADKYSVNYDIWKKQIFECYSQVNKAIGDLSKQKMTDYQYVTDGVSKVKYSSGTVIYVNYNHEDVNADGITFPGYSYVRTGKESESD